MLNGLFYNIYKVLYNLARHQIILHGRYLPTLSIVNELTNPILYKYGQAIWSLMDLRQQY